jgi:hypothetical protein
LEEHVASIFRVKYLSQASIMMVSGLAYTLNLKMEAAYSSETSDDFQWTTQQCMPDDTTPQVSNGVLSLKSNATLGQGHCLQTLLWVMCR